MFDTFASVSHRFGQIRVPDEHLPGEWVSPYRLLFGAAYSIGAAERSLASRTGEATEVPVDLSSSLNGAIQDEGRTIAWLYFWRASYLRAQRETFPGPMTVALPLVCAFIQTDIDKHVAYRPLKELRFDGTLAAGAFLEACDLWDAAIDAERGTR